MQAILILAHNNPIQLIKLVKTLNKRFLVYIHFDKKYQLRNEDIVKIKNLKNTYFYQEIDVNWGGVSIADAMIFLLKKALLNTKIDFFHFISGQDWPVNNIEIIYNFYKEHKDTIFMDYSASEGIKKSGEYIINWQKFYFFYDRLNRRSLFGKVFHRISMIIQSILKVNKFKKYNIDYPIYQGANWCNLPRYAAEYCIEFLSKNENYYKMLKTGFCSDEVLFQTILANSKYKYRICTDIHRYINWNKKNNSYPAILDEKDLDKLLSGKYHFARKIDLNISEHLLKGIENNYGKV